MMFLTLFKKFIWTETVKTNATIQTHVSQLVNSFRIPPMVLLRANPIPLEAITLNDPIREQTPIHISSVLVAVSKK